MRSSSSSSKMRAWVCVAVSVVVTVGVAGNNGRVDSNVRLGLLATQLGVNPVPHAGGPHNGNIGAGRDDHRVCQCIPFNQQCPYDANGHIIDGIVTRIANTKPLLDGECEENFIRCCGLPPIPLPGGPIRGKCGGRGNIRSPYRAIPPQADFGEYPWMAVILDPRNEYLGGGVLISARWVLTAAHKISNKGKLIVRVGDYDLKNNTDHPYLPHLEFGVVNTIIHPRFNPESLAYDVALLQLDRPVPIGQYPHIGLACLPNQGQKFEGQRRCFVSGWGKDSFTNGQFQSILKEVDVPIVERFSCQSRLRLTRLGENFQLDGHSFLCAGGIKGKDACSGDGGSPLVCPTSTGYTVVGLVAWGIGCAEGDVPGVYVNVANFIDFIKQYTGQIH